MSRYFKVRKEIEVEMDLEEFAQQIVDGCSEGDLINEIADWWFVKFKEEDRADAIADAKNQLNKVGQKFINLLAGGESDENQRDIEAGRRAD